MRLDTTGQNGITIDHQMMRGNGCCQIAIRGADIAGGLLCGDMFKHNAQFRQGCPQRGQHTLDKDGLSVKNINSVIDNLTMDQKRNIHLCHCL